MRAEGKNRPSDFEECQKYAVWAIHYAQDAVNPPHVDPWAEGRWWGISPAPHTCFEMFDQLAWGEHDLDLGRPQITLFDSELDAGLPTLKATMKGLAEETDGEWPHAGFDADWPTWDPFRGEPRDFFRYFCDVRVVTDSRAISVLKGRLF